MHKVLNHSFTSTQELWLQAYWPAVGLMCVPAVSIPYLALPYGYQDCTEGCMACRPRSHRAHCFHQDFDLSYLEYRTRYVPSGHPGAS